MSKYIPTPNLWDLDTHNAVVSGKLKLQCGQWIYAGNRQHLSRFVAVTDGGSILAAHWEGEKDKTTKRFHVLRTIAKPRMVRRAA